MRDTPPDTGPATAPRRRLAARVACLLGLLLIAACGGSSAGTAAQSVGEPILPPDDLADGRVAGAVGRVNPVVVAPAPSALPAGATALAGAELRALDVRGTLRATAMAGPDGAFLLEGLPTGLVRIEIREDPAAPDPDLVVEATVAPDMTVPLGVAPPVDRDAAIVAALEGVPPGALVAGSLNPFPAGTVVYPLFDAAGGSPVAPHTRVLPADEWFFYVVPDPHAEYAAEVEYVFVDAQGGAVTRASESFPPLVNHGRLWFSRDGLFRFSHDPERSDPIDRAPGATAEPTAELVQMPAPPAPHPDRSPGDVYPAPLGNDVRDALVDPLRDGPALANHNTDDASVFVVFLRTGGEPHFGVNVNRLANALRDAGVPAGNMAAADFTGIPEPDVDTGELPASEGLRVRREALRELVCRAVLHHEPVIEERLARGEHSTLVVYICGHGGSGQVDVNFDGAKGSWGFRAEHMCIEETRACRVRVILQGCHAEKFVDGLSEVFATTEHDVVAYAASARGESAYYEAGYEGIIGAFRNAWNQAGSYYTTRFSSHVDVVDGDLANVTETMGGQVVMRGELRELDGMPPPPWIRPGLPSWCHPDDASLGEAVSLAIEVLGPLFDDARTAAEEVVTEVTGEVGSRIETLLEDGAQVRQALEDWWRADEVGEETNHSAPSVGRAVAVLAHTEIVGSFAARVALTAAQAFDAFGNTDFPAGAGEHGFTVAATMPRAVTEGDTLVVVLQVDGAIPLADPDNHYQYGFVFDADGNPANDFEPVQGFENDLFGGTDRWHALEYTPDGGWILRVTDARNNQVTEVASAARAIIHEREIVLVVPMDEFADPTPRYRTTAFCHGGDFGFEPPHEWSGDTHPPVHEPLLAIP